MANIIGIDLGTTMSAISTLNANGSAEIIPNSYSERIVPSVLYFRDGQDQPLVGTEAKNASAENPERVVKEIKREMCDEDYRFTVDGRQYSAAQLSAKILKYLGEEAEGERGALGSAVISVPAHFKETERNATVQAGKLAGLDVIGVVNEPTAAALYYATSHDVKGNVLVYDLGGGTFDVTITRVNGQDVQILASEGDSRLGGVDFDRELLKLLEKAYYDEKISDLITNDTAGQQQRAQLMLDAELRLKKPLSKRDQVKHVLRGPAGEVEVEITREQFNDAISTHIARTELLVEKALMEADMTPQDIDYAVLVGGSTRIPAIRESLAKLIGQEPVSVGNVDEAVALGAAIQAGLKAVKEKPEEVGAGIRAQLESVKMRDVASHSFGIINVGEDHHTRREVLQNDILIKKNTPVPTSVTKTYYTMSDNQDVIHLQVTQGEGSDPDFVDTIFDDNMPIPTGRAKGQPVEITYSYDDSGIMHCVFKDVESGGSREVDLHTSAADPDDEPKSALDGFVID